MKLVKENLNEKFKEDSDPVEDLGIGILAKTKEFDNFLDDLWHAEHYRSDDDEQFSTMEIIEQIQEKFAELFIQK